MSFFSRRANTSGTHTHEVPSTARRNPHVHFQRPCPQGWHPMARIGPSIQTYLKSHGVPTPEAAEIKKQIQKQLPGVVEDDWDREIVNKQRLVDVSRLLWQMRNQLPKDTQPKLLRALFASAKNITQWLAISIPGRPKTRRFFETILQTKMNINKLDKLLGKKLSGNTKKQHIQKVMSTLEKAAEERERISQNKTSLFAPWNEARNLSTEELKWLSLHRMKHHLDEDYIQTTSALETTDMEEYKAFLAAGGGAHVS